MDRSRITAIGDGVRHTQSGNTRSYACGWSWSAGGDGGHLLLAVRRKTGSRDVALMLPGGHLLSVLIFFLPWSAGALAAARRRS